MGGSSTSTQTVTVPPEVLARYNAVNTRAEETSQRPFIPYSTDPNAFVAGLSPTQQAGIYGTNVASTMAQPFYGQAVNQLMGAQQAAVPFYGSAAQMNMLGSQAIRPQQINQAMSPYLGTVLQSTAALQNQMNQQAMSGQLGNAIRQGAFGGDRAGIAAANLAQQQQLASSKTFSDLLNQGYGQAVGIAQADRAALQQGAAQQAALGQGLYGIGSGTSQQLAALGQGAQAAGLAGAQAQLGAGQAQQQTEQAGRTALYNQFLQQQSYPFQVAQFLANVAMGTGALSGSTTTTNQPGGLFSDRRLKENVEPIGKTFDGQPIYKYNYKGDDTTQIGLMAQNVERHHPEAVGLAGGYKTVNYDKATRDAAERGHFAYGGASMGGGVMPSSAGQGFADGGFTGYDPAMMQQILASYQQMYAPLGGLGAAEGSPTGFGRNIPTQGLAQHNLMTAGELPKAGPSGIEQMKTLADTASEMKDLGSDIKGFFKKKSEEDSTDEEEKAYGGLVGYASGGSPMPYEKYMTGPQLDIPEEDPSKKAKELQKPGQMGKPRSAMEDVKDIASTVATVASLFSDKRLKENIRPIGKTYDGQTVYSYNYKGDKTTQIGLIAQEVERHHPNAVSHAGKYKTVDYDKATGLAAKRGHFAVGGNTEEDEEEPSDVLDLNKTLMKGINPEADDRSFLQQLLEESESRSKEEPEQGSEEAASGAPGVGAPAPVDAALNVANKAISEPAGQGQSHSPGLLGKISKVEGTAKNPKSSAVGKYQIIDSTFVNYFRKLHPEEARSMSKSEILALRNSPKAKELYEEMGPAITEDNKSKLRSMKLPVNDANVYAMHFLGPTYGPKVITADAGTPVERLVPANFISSNPSVLKGKTAGQVRDWLDKKMLATGGAARHGYATDGAVEDEDEQTKSIVDKAVDVADRAVGEPENLIPENFGKVETPQPKLTAEQAKPILEQSLKTKTISPQDYANVYRSAGTAAPEMPRQMADLGIGVANAPSAGVAPKGVSQAAKEAVPEGEKPKKEGLGHRIFHPEGRTDYLVPILTGLAGMVGAPTRNPFQALAYGVGAGAMGLQKQREFDLQRQMVGVRSGEAAANLMGKAINLYRPNPDPLTRDQYPWVDPSNRLVTDAQRNQAVMGMVSMMGTTNNRWSPDTLKKILTPEGVGVAAGQLGATPQGAQPGMPTGIAPPAAPGVPAAPKAPAAPPVKERPIPAGVEARAAAGVYRLPQPTTPLDYTGLSDMDNPAKLREFYKTYAGSADPRLAERAKSYLDRANRIDQGEIPVTISVTGPDGAPTMQAWNGWQQRKSDIDRYQSLRSAANKAATDTNQWSEVFSQNRDKVLNVFQKLAQASADANLNRGANYKANFIGYVESIPGLSEIVPESFRRFQSAADEGDKYAAAQQIMVDVENKLTRAPATGLQMAQRMAPGVTTAPSARYSYIVDNVAKILQDNAFNDFWNKNKNNIEDVSRARQDWYNQNPLSKYMRRAIDQTPFAAGMPQADRLKLISRKQQKAPVYQNGALQMKDGKPVMGNTIVYYPTAAQKASLPDGAYYVSNGKLVIKGARKAAQ